MDLLTFSLFVLLFGALVWFTWSASLEGARLQNRIDAVRHDVEDGEARIDRLRDSITSLQEERGDLYVRVNGLSAALDKHDKAAGGFWRMANGTTIRVRDMSDGHIENCLRMVAEEKRGGPGIFMQQLMEAELTRREIDRDFRKEETEDARAEIQFAFGQIRSRLAEFPGSISVCREVLAKNVLEDLDRLEKALEELK